MTSTPYYAQENGQVEEANKGLITLIQKTVKENLKSWHKILDQALWAYRNSPGESTNTTPFRLSFGHNDVLPTEICLQSTRNQRQCEIPINYYWDMVLDELVDLDEERLRALDVLTRQKERIAKSYNKRVKPHNFAVNGLVWKVILTMNRRDQIFGKLSPSWQGP